MTVADSASLRLTTGLTVEGWTYPTTGGASWQTLAHQGGAAATCPGRLYAFGAGGLPGAHVNSGGDLWAIGQRGAGAATPGRTSR